MHIQIKDMFEVEKLVQEGAKVVGIVLYGCDS